MKLLKTRETQVRNVMDARHSILRENRNSSPGRAVNAFTTAQSENSGSNPRRNTALNVTISLSHPPKSANTHTERNKAFRTQTKRWED